MKLSAVSALFALAGLLSAAEASITESRKYTDPKIGLTVVAGDVSLPADGAWSVIQPGNESGLAQIQLALSPSEQRATRGDRARKADAARRIEQERYTLSSIHYMCVEYARTNNGIGPATWDDFLQSNKVRHVSSQIPSYKTNFVLLSSVPIQWSGTGRVERAMLAMQLHPRVADGKHWVLFNDGRTERVPVDLALCARYGVVVEPIEKPEVEVESPASNRHFVVTALLAAPRQTSLAFSNEITGAVLSLAWDTEAATNGSREVMSQWAEERAIGWAPFAVGGDAPVLRHWLSRCEALYGAGVNDFADDGGRNRGEAADAFSVLGGRAAVRETLQMQPLRMGSGSNAGSTIAISTIPGVVVTSHPFEQMLKAVKPGLLPLADSVPADRGFVYFPRPDALLPLLDGGADFIFQSGSLALADTTAYDLKNRYVDRLALTDAWVRDLLLKSGAVKELAILFPDLFFIDGTEVTVLAWVPTAPLLKPLLGSLGIGDLTGGIQEKSSPAGKSFWAMDGDLLIISTSRAETDRIMALRKAGGIGSLGQSAEFRYMLSQMPLQAGTRFYAYLSDPFIRRLVSPEVKIGQRRRLVAKGEMERVSAAALLYRLDGQTNSLDLSALLAKGYLAAEPSAASGCTLDDRLIASCPTYGSPARLKTLLENPVTTVSLVEAEAYKAYVENYSRFWRQYFDPMAFRLDDGADGELQLTTFILPLVDNTIYNGLKEVMRHKEDGTPLRVPDLNPKPLLLLSANLSEESWTQAAGDMFSGFLRRYTTLDPAAFDKIGPGIHLAIHDADPILTFGAGDALGIFGAPMLSGGRNSEMLFIPAIASILTRPCQILVELQDPDAMRRMMRAAASVSVDPGRREAVASFYKMDGRDAWVCSISIMNAVKVRFGVEVGDRYLVLSNLPWSQKPAFGSTREADLNALALDLHPEAGVLQVPGLFTAACEQEREAAIQGERHLYPLLASGAGSVSNAAEQCRMLFGFVPEHPGHGQWVWENGRIRSTVYGDIRHAVQPEYKAGDRAFGVLGGLDNLNLNLQFEDAGLRVITRWKLKAPPAAP